jgi:FixJ family two-component response regulator
MRGKGRFEVQACVSVVDDDALVLRSLGRLLRSAGFTVNTYPSPQAFLAQGAGDTPGCVVLDLSMPGLSGLDLQKALASSPDPRPVVFISARGDVPSSVAAMKAGAVDFLTKPFDQEQLLAAVHAAIERDRSARIAREERSSIGERVATLTPREREVLSRVVDGRLNKQIAAELGTAEKTVKVHRARMMRKMGVDSLAGLVRAWTVIRQTGAQLP